jgi:hypothetical protein
VGVAELGRLIGVSHIQNFRYESRQQSAATRLDAIAEALGVDVADLLTKPVARGPRRARGGAIN